MNFKSLAEEWILRLQKQVELGKMKPASADTFINRVRLHAIPALGTLEVQDVRNGKVKEFAEKLATKFKPKTVRECIAVVKAVLRSHVNEDGEPLVDLSKWNNKFIFSGVRDVTNQRRPTISCESINAIIKNRDLKVMHRVFVALGASTGMRRGELLAVRYAGDEETTSWDKEASAIFVRKSIWDGKEQEPKSIAGIRRIDVSSSVNKMLTEYVEVEKKNPGDYLFCTRTGRALTPSRVNELIMKPNNIPGAHSLRRYRSGYMDAQGCPRNFLSELMGHSLASNIDEIYIIRDDVEHRRKIVEKIGTGLDLAAATLPVSKSKATKPRKTRKISVVAEAEAVEPVESSSKPLTQLASF